MLERYRVKHRLESGGHSVVYVATDTHLSREVCIKAFHKLGIQEGRLRSAAHAHFVKEAYALSSLCHPNTLRIYDFGHADDHGGTGPCPVQVSEYMLGGTLSQRIRNSGPMAPHLAISMVCKLADALGEAHRKCIVHRDIKPQNILFTAPGPSGEPKLADFGIAKSTTRQEDEGVGGRLAMYSASWASPEQLLGVIPVPNSDIYAMGLIATFALTGRAIVASKSAKDGYERRRHAHELLHSALKERCIGERLVKVLAKACAFDAEDRYSDCAELSAALKAAGELDHQQLDDASPESSSVRAKGTRPPSVRSVAGLSSKFATPRLQTSRFQPPPQQPQTSPHGASSLRLHPNQRELWVGSRQCSMVALGESATISLAAHRVKILGTPHPGSPHGYALTIVGVTTFLCKVGRRVSRSLHVDQDSSFDIIDMQARAKERLFVSFGRRDQGDKLFLLDRKLIRLDAALYPHAVLLDSPSHNRSFIFYPSPS